MNTRQKLIHQAQILFSQQGFYGTSINDIAKTLNISKQALLHHFSSKEKLYAEVIEQAADSLMSLVDKHRAEVDSPRQQLQQILFAMSEDDSQLMTVVALLMRELLDNWERANTAQKWYLRPFLDALVTTVKAGQELDEIKAGYPLAIVYQLLGAAQYYAISLPTLRQLYSDEEFAMHKKAHLQLLENML